MPLTRGNHTRSPSSRPTSKTLCPALACVTRATAELPSFHGVSRKKLLVGVVALSALVTDRQLIARINALNSRPTPVMRSTGLIWSGESGGKVALIERVF
jgi:hypothetical protein